MIRSAAEIRDDTPGTGPPSYAAVLALVAAVVAAIVFGFLTAEVWHSQGSVSWEWPIIWRANRHPPPGADFWIALFDPVFFALILVALATAALRQRRVRLALAGTAGCLLATIAAEHVLKPIVERRRAFHRHQFFHPNVHLGTLTYPSGHVAAAAACAAFAWFVIGRRHPAGFLVFVVPVIVAWAEIASDGHYPADTVAGFIVGVFAVCATVLAVEKASCETPEMTDDAVMRAWRLHRYGRPTEVLQLDEVPIPEPEAGELRVKIHAIPFNLNDLERITGGNMMVRPELPYSPGMEVMGVVDVCGAGTEEWMGRRVVAMPKGAHGGFAEYALCPVVSAFDMPDSVPLPGAAALYFPFHLAWLGLYDRAELQAGESVLIHAAAGGSGSAAIQLAKHVGARVFATAGTDAKVQLCRDLGADVAINYNDADFAEIVLAETGNHGVEVVFDNVGEAVFEKSLQCTAYNGRYLMMGFASNKLVADEPFVVPRRIALGNLKLCGVLLAYQAPEMADMIKTAMGWNFVPASLGEEITRRIVDLVVAGAIKPVVGETITFEEIPTAIEAMESRQTVGRTIVMLEP